MPTLPIINVKTDPLDALLYGLGLRLSSLAKGENESYHNLVKDKELAIQFKRGDDVARYYRFVDGHFGQASGTARHADLTIEFKDSMTGVQLLTKGDMTDFMSAVQDGDVVILGDHKLILWFASVAKQGATLPEPYANYVEQAKPYIEQARPYLDKVGDFANKIFGTSCGQSGKK